MRGDALDADLPAALLVFIKRCLQKDPRERIRDIGDVRLALAGHSTCQFHRLSSGQKRQSRFLGFTSGSARFQQRSSCWLLLPSQASPCGP